MADPCRPPRPGNMRRPTSRQRFATTALLIAVAAGVGAVAAFGGGDPHGSGPPARGAASNRPARGHGDLAVAADYLGLSRAQVRDALRAGRTLAKVAGTTGGKSSAGLV